MYDCTACGSSRRRRGVELWLYGRVLLEHQPFRERSAKIDRVVDSLGRRGPRDLRRPSAALAYGLEQRVGRALTRTERQLHDRLLDVAVESPRLALCRHCGAVFERRRHDQRWCGSKCKNGRPVKLPAKRWWWLRLSGGPIEYLDECLARGAAYWAGAHSKGACPGCGSNAGRQRRLRARRVAGSASSPGEV